MIIWNSAGHTDTPETTVFRAMTAVPMIMRRQTTPNSQAAVLVPEAPRGLPVLPEHRDQWGPVAAPEHKDLPGPQGPWDLRGM